jgi:hypothetical protein
MARAMEAHRQRQSEMSAEWMKVMPDSIQPPK